jgi:tetratricopeptide (TPR) repeat protein
MATVRAEQRAEAAFLQTILHEVEREGCLVEMDVPPLSREDTRTLIRSLAPSAPEGSEHTVLELVWTVSEGNPLVVLEALRDREQFPVSPDVARLPVPLRVRKIIAEHVARLDSRCQETLAAAAVIGRRFDFALLQRARGSTAGESSAVLEELVRKCFLQASGNAFYFTHDRIREVVYESLLSPRRRIVHGAVARALEELHSTRIDEVCGTIGYHFARAGEAEASIRHLMRFAERASKHHGLEEAFAALGEARRQVPDLPASQREAIAVGIAIGRAQCLLFLGRVAEIEPVLAPHRETVDRLDLPALVAPFHAMAAFAHVSLGDRRKANEHETSLLALLERSDDAQPAGIALSLLGFDAMVAGRYRSGIERALEAVAKLDEDGDPESAGFAWVHLAGNYLGAGECWKALDAASRAIVIGERHDVARVQSLGLLTVALLRVCAIGETEVGIAACRRAIALAPDPYVQWWSHYAHVRVCAWDFLVLNGSLARPFDAAFEASITVMEEVARSSRDSPLGPWAGTARLALAEAHLAKGDAASARIDALSAVDALGPGADPLAVSGARRAAGYAELSLGNFDRAAIWFDEARRFAEPITPLETAAAVMGRGLVAIAQRDHVTARGLFKEAHRMYAALRLPFWTGTVERLAGEHAVTI